MEPWKDCQGKQKINKTAPAESIQAIQAKKVMSIVLNGVELGMASKYYYYSKSSNE